MGKYQIDGQVQDRWAINQIGGQVPDGQVPYRWAGTVPIKAGKQEDKYEGRYFKD